MKRLLLRNFDLTVRAGGLALILLTVLCLSLLPGHRGEPAAPPSTLELCLALCAVCSASVGASLACVGRQMFEPVPNPRMPRPARATAPLVTGATWFAVIARARDATIWSGLRRREHTAKTAHPAQRIGRTHASKTADSVR